MKPTKDYTPLPKRTIWLINACLALVAVVFITGAIGAVKYKQWQADREKVLLAQQEKAAEALKTSFPDYRNSQDYKEKTEMAIAKISIDEVQEGGATIVAGLTVILAATLNGRLIPGIYRNTKKDWLSQIKIIKTDGMFLLVEIFPFLLTHQ